MRDGHTKKESGFSKVLGAYEKLSQLEGTLGNYRFVWIMLIFDTQEYDTLLPTLSCAALYL